MAFELAPWLQPQNFLDSIRSGAQLGLQVRNTDLEQAQMAQKAQEFRNQLQQSWAEKVMANQQKQADLVSAQNYQMQNLGLEGQRNLEANAHNQSMEDIQAFNATKPQTHFYQGSGWTTQPDGTMKQTLTAPENNFRPGPPITLDNGIQLYQASRGRWAAVPKPDPWATPRSAMPNPVGQGSDPGSEVAPMSLQTNSVMPSPAAGTMGLPPVDEARAFANGLINNAKRDPNGVRARFKQVYGQEL